MSAGSFASLTAQGALVSGRVDFAHGRSVPVAGAWAVLHEVSMARQAAIDSTRTDAGGRYRFRVAAPDTGAIYLVSSARDGIAYFSQPQRVAPGGRVSIDPLMVYDTSTSGAPVAVERLLVTVAKPKPDGSRDVLHVLELHNRDLTTRVAADTTRPTWRGLLPKGALQFQIGESDFSSQAVAVKGDSLLVFGPVQPGVPRQLSFAFVLPATATIVPIPVDQPLGQVHVLLEDTTATVVASVATSTAIEHIEGRTFRRYSMTGLPAGATLIIRLPTGSGPFTVDRAIPILVGVMILALLAGLVIALRRRSPPPAPAT